MGCSRSWRLALHVSGWHNMEHRQYDGAGGDDGVFDRLLCHPVALLHRCDQGFAPWSGSGHNCFRVEQWVLWCCTVRVEASV